MPQYLRKSFPPPDREVYQGTVIHYFDTELRSYIGSEVITYGVINLFHFDPTPVCEIDTCHCFECLSELRKGNLIDN